MRNVYINREKYLEEDALFIWITSSLMNYDILKNDIINYFAKNTLPLYCFVIYPKSLILDFLVDRKKFCFFLLNNIYHIEKWK